MTVAEEQIVAFLQTMIRLVVSEPTEARVYSKHVERCLVIDVKVARCDIGRVIGRRGGVANSIRSLVEAAGGQHGVRCQVNLPHATGGDGR